MFSIELEKNENFQLESTPGQQCFSNYEHANESYPIKTRMLSKLPQFLVNMIKEFQESNKDQGEILFIQMEKSDWLHLMIGSLSKESVVYWNIFNISERKLYHKKKIHLKRRKNAKTREKLVFHVRDETYLAIGSSSGIIYLFISYSIGGDLHRVKQLTMNDLGKKHHVKQIRWFKDILIVNICKTEQKEDQLYFFDIGLNALKFQLSCGNRVAPKILRGLNPRYAVTFQESEKMDSIQSLSQLKEFLKQKKYKFMHGNEIHFNSKDHPNTNVDKLSHNTHQISNNQQLKHLNPLINSILFSENKQNIQIHFGINQKLTFRFTTGFFEIPNEYPIGLLNAHQVKPLSNVFFALHHMNLGKPKKAYGVIRNLRDPSETLTCILKVLNYLLIYSMDTSHKKLLRTLFTKYAPLFGMQPQFKELFHRYISSVMREGDLDIAYQLCLQLKDEPLYRVLFHCALEHHYFSIACLVFQHLEASYQEMIRKKQLFMETLKNHPPKFNISDVLKEYESIGDVEKLDSDKRYFLGAYFEIQGDNDRALLFYPKSQSKRLLQ